MDAYTVWHVKQSSIHGYVNIAQPPEFLIKAIQAVAAVNIFFWPTFSHIKQDVALAARGVPENSERS